MAPDVLGALQHAGHELGLGIGVAGRPRGGAGLAWRGDVARRRRRPVPSSEQRIDAQDQRDHDDGDQAEAALEQAAAQRDRDAATAEAAAAKATTAESAAFAAAILDVAALVAIHLHGSVSVRLTIYGGDEPDRRHLEHQFGPPADRQRRTLPEVAQARRALPAGDQVPRRILPAPAFEALGYTPPAGAGHEVLQRRGHPLEGAVHGDERAPSLRQGGLPAYRGGARYRRRSDPARQSLHPGRRRHSRSRANVKFAHKLDFYREMAGWYAERKPSPRARKGLRRIAVGDLNVAPLEHDVWSHKQLLKIVSHTPIEVELFGRMMAAMDWIDVPRRFVPAEREALFVVELPQQRLAQVQPRPPARPYPGHPGACPGPSAAITSTSTCATGSSLRTMCRCWRRSTSDGRGHAHHLHHPDRLPGGPGGALDRPGSAHPRILDHGR